MSIVGRLVRAESPERIRPDPSRIVPMNHADRPVWDSINRWKNAADGYRKVTVLHTCLNVLASAASDAELQVFEGSPHGEHHQIGADTIAGKPITLPCADPTLNITPIGLTERNWLDGGMHGEAWNLKLRSQRGIWVETRPLRADRMDVLVNKDGSIKKYPHSETGARTDEFDTEDIILFKRYDPINDYRGLTAIYVLEQEGTLSVAGNTIRYMDSYFNGGGIPSYALETDQPLTQDDSTAIEKRIAEKTGGYGYDGIARWRRPLILSNGVKVKPISAGPEDVSLAGILDPIEARICAITGVPAIIAGIHIGLVQTATYGTGPVAREFMYKQRIIPALERDAEIWTLHLRREFGGQYFARYDIENVSALEATRTARRDESLKGWNGGLLTRAQALPAWGYKPRPGDDSTYKVQPSTVIEAGA